LQSHEQVSRTKHSSFIGFEKSRETHILSNTVGCLRVVGIHEMGQTIAQVNLVYMFVVMNENEFETVIRDFLSMVMRMLLSSLSGNMRHPHACLALVCCPTLSFWHTHLETMSLKKFAAMKILDFAFRLYVCSRTWQTPCARLFAVSRAGFQNKLSMFTGLKYSRNAYLARHS
jgi:hypothetical protein